MTTSSMIKMGRKYLVLSDIHLGCRTTPGHEILNKLTSYFDDFSSKSDLASLDAIIIAGDLWDDSLQMDSMEFLDFIPWFDRLLHFAERNRIEILLLEGTPRHDRDQNKTVMALVKRFHGKVSFRHISELSIEYIDSLGMNILFVPDEAHGTALETQHAVELLLAEKNLTQVDAAIMHGMFKYQLGTIPMGPKVHDEVWYLDRVKHYINIGHIHTASQYSRILAQGSFERLNHGDEGPKGGYVLTEIKPGEWAPFFRENTQAKTYITLTISDKDSIEKAQKRISDTVGTLKPDSYLRVAAKPTHPILQGIEQLKKQYPLINFSKKVLENKRKSEEEEVKVQDYRPIVLNEKTLTAAVIKEVNLTRPLTPAEEKRLSGLLKDLHQ